jgi:penicillin-binding protein 2
VALDPQTGAVLALASAPTYDPTWWTPNGISTAHYDQLLAGGALNDNVIDGLYTPGSTFKLATATAALNDGLITPGYTFDDNGVYHVGNTTFHDNDGEAAGVINVSRALTVSSDIFFYNLGVMFWDQRGKYQQTPIQDAGNALGYGEPTGIDLPGETQDARIDSPQVVAKEHAQDPAAYPDGGWFTGNNLEMAFGQGGTVITPIEQAVAYATFANGGTRYAPQLASEIVNPLTGKIVKKLAPQATGHVTISPTNYSAILQGLEGVIANPSGTAYGDFTGFPSAWNLAGKTGTASNQANQEPNSWFVAFGPNPNPQYLVLAVIGQGGYGASAAAPLVRTIFNYIAANQPQISSPVKTPTPKSPPSDTVPTTTTTTTPGATPAGGTAPPTTTTTVAGP